MATSDRLKPKQPVKRAALPEMKVTVQAPNVDVNMPAPQISTKEIAVALDQLAGIMTQLAKQQEAILSALKEQYQVLGVLANREAKIEAPTVKIPPRPSVFEVQIARPGEEPTTMRVNAAKMN